jgi:hypothetical protein
MTACASSCRRQWAPIGEGFVRPLKGKTRRSGLLQRVFAQRGRAKSTRRGLRGAQTRVYAPCRVERGQTLQEPASTTLRTLGHYILVVLVMALAAGDSWLDQGANVMLFGPPGGGKSHLAAALGLALVQNGRRVLFIRTTDLVQRLQVARRDLELEAAINKLDKYQLLILDDIAYVTKDQAETSVLFELIAARYEHRSLLITANQPFGEWGKIFTDKTMTLAAIDRLVHHATILEMNVESYRRKAALKRKRGKGD